MVMLEITIPLEPVPFSRPRTAGGEVWFNAGPYAKFLRDVKRIIPKLPELWDGPIRLTARFITTPPKRRKHGAHWATKPDLSNFIKALEDALEGVIWTNDSRICEYGAGCGKFYDMAGGAARIEIKAERLS